MDLLETNNAGKVRDLLENAKHIAIIPSKVAGADSYCAAAGLFHMLLQDERPVTLIHTGKVPEICEGLVDKELITSDIKSRELMVTIDYSNTPAARVHYFTENDVLTLKLSPVDKDFDFSRIRAHLAGFNFDVVITLGVLENDDLGQTYHELENELRAARIINVDNNKSNSLHGYVNVIDNMADNLSMVVYKNAALWGLSPNTKSAKALLTGMTYKEPRVDKS